jgi:hypothetical protein
MSVSWRFLIQDIFDGGWDSPGYDIISMEWSLGFSPVEASVAGLSMAKVVLWDMGVVGVQADQLISKFCRIESVATVAGTTVHFTGFVKDMVMTDFVHEVELRIVGIEWPIHSQKISIPLVESGKAGAIVQSVVDESVFLPRLFGLYLNVSPLDQSRLRSIEPDLDLDVGQSIFPYVGDSWENIKGVEIVRDVVESEQGKFFAARDGTLTLHDRHALYKNRPAVVDLNSIITDQQFIMGGGKYTVANVAAQGRELASELSVVWAIDEPVEIPPRDDMFISGFFRDSNRLPVGAVGVLPPVALTDYIAEDENGVDKTIFLQVSMVEVTGRKVRLNITHDQDGVLTVTTLQVRGYALTLSSPLTVQVKNCELSSFAGERSLDISTPLVGSLIEAQNVAGAALARYRFYKASFSARVVTYWDWVELSSVDTELALTLGLFDRVKLTNSFLIKPVGGLVDATMVVVHEHHWVGAQDEHIVRLGLDFDYSTFFLVGDNIGDVLGTLTPVIGY